MNNDYLLYIETRRLAGLSNDNLLLPDLASSSINIYPYQIAAAKFAIRKNYINGCILCDEASLDKIKYTL